ncbi:MAG: hypothetical protein QOF89_6030 [Acidobacteriota bacterium]|nr:hypothetical protein [Acidobacteriota bacterium]
MAKYVWQLGIDWNAVETEGVSYLRGGLLKEINGEAVTWPGTEQVEPQSEITFRIFDVSSSAEERQVGSIDSFSITTKAAVKDQQSTDPLSSHEPADPQGDPNPSQSLFGSAYCSWTYSPVTVNADSGRFLLTLYVQATGTDNSKRFFRHDPEMVVGPNT